MARYYQRSNKWQVVIELGMDERTGKRLRHTKDGFKTKREAITYATQKKIELLNGINPTNSKVLLKDFIMDWYNNHICKTLALNTISNYKSRIETHIIPYMGNMKLNKITTADVQRFYYHLMDKKLKPYTAKRIIQVLTSCFKYAKKLNLISTIPTDIEYFKDEYEDKVKVWDETQLNYFLSQINNNYLYLPVLTTVLTGMRIGELCGLRWTNVDLENGEIHICEQVIQDKISKTLVHTNILKTSKSNRTISIPPMLIKVLSNVKPNKNIFIEKINDFVILNRDGGMCKPRNLSMNFTKVVAKYKKSIDDFKTEKEIAPIGYMQLPQITFHDLRHTHATILLLHGENIKVISERLGHKSTKITLDTYSHVLPKMEKHTANLLENVFNDNFKNT